MIVQGPASPLSFLLPLRSVAFWIGFLHCYSLACQLSAVFRLASERAAETVGEREGDMNEGGGDAAMNLKRGWSRA